MLKLDWKYRKRLTEDFEFYAQECLKIRKKNGKIQPFILNYAQKHATRVAEKQMREKGFVRIIIVKGRQEGISTKIQGRAYWRVTFDEGFKAFIIAHEDKATKNLFTMAKRYHENCPDPVRPKLKVSNEKALTFDGLDSSYSVGTAKNKSVGRSDTVQFLHASEVALFAHPEEHAKGIMETVPDLPGTEIWLESTARGRGNWFHDKWVEAEKGESDFIAVFIPWFWDDGYQRPVPKDFERKKEEEELVELYKLSDAQLVWRRMKIKGFSSKGADGVLMFNQEYPNCSAEAFISDGGSAFIGSKYVMYARQNTHIEPFGPLVIGVDPAWKSERSDRTSIAWRRGCVVEKIESFNGLDTMQLVGVLHEIIQRDRPLIVNIDVGGLGIGVAERLVEVGRHIGYEDIINFVNFGGAATLDHIYENRRAEMYDTVRKLCEERKIRIPDSESLHSDLVACQRQPPSSTGRLVIESKKSMKERNVRSPDEADSVVLLWAVPVSNYQDRIPEKVLVRGVWV